jgi:hypothetical protein
LGVFVPNKATLGRATSAFGAAARLQIAVADKPTLRFAAAVHRAAIGLAVGVFDEAALTRLGQCHGDAAHQGANPHEAHKGPSPWVGLDVLAVSLHGPSCQGERGGFQKNFNQ